MTGDEARAKIGAAWKRHEAAVKKADDEAAATVKAIREQCPHGKFAGRQGSRFTFCAYCGKQVLVEVQRNPPTGEGEAGEGEG